jgi:lysophospholipase L1-like esterase
LVVILLLTGAISGSACAGSKGVTPIYCIGDSLTYGWPDPCTTYPQALQTLLDSSHPHGALTVVNEGIGGNTTAQMLARFGADVVDQEPDVVIIWGGIK